MVHDFDSAQRLRPSTTVLLYAAYVVDLTALGWLALRPAWSLPIGAGPAIMSGAPLIIAGAAVDVTAVTGFGSAGRLSGVESGELITGGIYRLSRNPQHLGIITMLVGVSLARRSADAVFGTGLVALAFDRWIRHEETNLGYLFGDDYARYRSTTSRWIGGLSPPA